MCLASGEGEGPSRDVIWSDGEIPLRVTESHADRSGRSRLPATAAGAALRIKVNSDEQAIGCAMPSRRQV